MQIPELAPALVARIQHAPPTVTNQQLAAELGVHRNTVRKYRLKARHLREEAARLAVAAPGPREVRGSRRPEAG
jgi:predicted ArsR family transcriptional regulator